VSSVSDSGWPLTWKTWKSQGIPKWSGKMEKVRGSEIRCVFSSSKYSKTRFFRPGLCPGPHWGSLQCSPDPLVGWGGRHPIPFPQLLQPQLLNNWLSSLTLFFINMKQRLLTISVNTRYRVIFTCLYWKSQWISCGLESGHPADCVVETVNFSLKWGMSTCNVLTLWVTVFLVHLFVWCLIHHMSVTVSSQ